VNQSCTGVDVPGEKVLIVSVVKEITGTYFYDGILSWPVLEDLQ
jgi:hypothetical protein